MSGATPPVGEDDLQAYIDDQIEASRRDAVERFLAGDRQAAQRVAAYLAQKELLRSALSAGYDDPLPVRLTLAGIIGERARRRLSWRFAASIVVAVGIGAAAGTLLRGPGPGERGRTERAMSLLENEALASHRVYAADRHHPVEVSGNEEPRLARWLSNRLDRHVMPPDLSALGYHIIGGRLLATERGNAAALLMYEDRGDHRLSVVLRPMAPDLHAPSANISGNHFNGQAWIAGGLGVAVVAAMPESELAPVSLEIRRELQASG